MENNRKRQQHTLATKRKIAKSNTGKVFSEERKRNIGLAGMTKVSEEALDEIKTLWSLGYVHENFIMKKFGFGKKVYDRLKKEHCVHAQIKYIPRDMIPEEVEHLMRLCRENVPYVDIASILNRHPKQVRLVIEKLSSRYLITSIAQSRGNHTKEHRAFLRENIASYNKANPKFGEDNGNWKNGRTKLRSKILSLALHKIWRKKVLERDAYKCVQCGTGKSLEVDHIYPFGLILEENKIESSVEAKKCAQLWDTVNGRVLCKRCHRKTETFAMRIAEQKIKFGLPQSSNEDSC